MSEKKRVLLGMSGGVDSSVSAVLLLEQGYEVIGAFMKNWSDEREDAEECSWRTERRDAMRVAAQLGIEFHTFDFEDAYRENVYEYMLREYEAGRTPNPDVLCNKYMKFGLFLEKADELGCESVATGHYARTRKDEDGTVHLLAGKDPEKDQSYFLCQLDQDQLKRALFPIGELIKSEVREIARNHDLSVAEKKDSQGICFVGKVELSEFLKKRIPERTGNIVTPEGKVLGQHQGHMYYTIGQRHGLGLAGGPYFIVERRPETNELVVVKDNDPALFSSKATATNLVETVPGHLQTFIGKSVLARIRYRQPLQRCQVTAMERGELHVTFDEPQRAVAPGQFLALYNDEELIASAVLS